MTIDDYLMAYQTYSKQCQLQCWTTLTTHVASAVAAAAPADCALFFCWFQLHKLLLNCWTIVVIVCCCCVCCFLCCCCSCCWWLWLLPFALFACLICFGDCVYVVGFVGPAKQVHKWKSTEDKLWVEGKQTAHRAELAAGRHCRLIR